MAPKKTRVELARERKWYARLWWVGFHLYDYIALAYVGTFSPKAQGMSEFVTCLIVAVLNVVAYVRLQTSSPGYLPASTVNGDRDLEGGDEKKAETTPAADAAGESDADRLVSTVDMGNSTVTRFCEDCQVMQPMRTKHCKDCERCVLQYDHHCDCAGACIGRDNRRLFMLYLFFQMLEGFQMIGVATAAFSLQSSIEEWLTANLPFMVVWFSILVVLLITIPLLGYQIYLVSANQTSWEHGRRSAITYLQHLPDEESPFDRGIIHNWWTFLRGGNSDVWVHPTAKPHHSPLRDTTNSDDDEIM